MGMGTIATTGMQAAMSDMDIVSNNIANATTIGFKRSSAQFADLFPSGSGSGTQIGLGVNLASISQDFTAGTPQSTGTKSNLCIGGDGFFVLKDASTGGIAYSRNGAFTFDPSVGYFMLGNDRLQGFLSTDGVTIPAGASLTDLYVSTAPLAANPSSKVTAGIGVNLNSTDAVPATTPFLPTDQTTYNFISNTTVYDSLGNPNSINLYYVKTSADNWSVYAVDGSNNVLNSATPGSLVFSTSGTLTSATNLSAITFTPSAGAGASQNFAVDVTNVTQFAQKDNPGVYSTDGYAAGIFTDYKIDKDGQVSVVYSNNKSKIMGQVGLATFATPEGLDYAGNAMWSANTRSGTAIIKPSNSLNNITSGSLEGSNVDMATELVKLINSQNIFQANAQVEQTYNQIMQTVTKL